MLLKKLEIGDLIAKGKRGCVYSGMFGGEKCVVKVERMGSGAMGRVKNEGSWLERLNKKNIGAKLFFFDEERVVMEFIDGVHLNDFLKGCEDIKKIKKVLKEVLRQCRILDLMKVNKYEMHRITKNVIVRKNFPVLIDFERCKVVEEPKNVSQFCTFLMKTSFFDVVFGDVVKIVREYKKDFSDKCFKGVENLFF